jgi:hypothetical protein
VTGSGLDDAVAELASARSLIQQAWHLVDEARTYTAGAQRALEDAEAETTRARMAPEGPLGAAYLSRARGAPRRAPATVHPHRQRGRPHQGVPRHRAEPRPPRPRTPPRP